MKLKFALSSALALGLISNAGCAQAPPPQPVAGAPAQPPPGPPPAPGYPASNVVSAALVSDSSSVRYVIYGPGGEVQAVVLRDEKVVTVPPDLGWQLRAALVRGASVRVSGIPQDIGQQRQLIAQTVQVSGQSYASAGPPPPPPAGGPAGPPPPRAGGVPPPPPPPQ